MSLNSSPKSSRVHIGFFGRRNAGKSSLINAFTNQETAIVSDKPGTTTDPVYKQMEIIGIGACEIIDTAGLDDSGELGEKRIEKTLEVLLKTDIAVYVTDFLIEKDRKIINLIKEKNIPLIIALNKCDIIENTSETEKELSKFNVPVILMSAKEKRGTDKLALAISKMNKDTEDGFLVKDLIKKGDKILLVTPMDASAPKGRLILPQQQVIREIIDIGAAAIISKEDVINEALAALKEPPDMVITDSKVFKDVEKTVPENVRLTSFSILFARQKGDIKAMTENAKIIDSLYDGDNILISEACTHHAQEDDIGRKLIPSALLKYTGKQLNFEFSKGNTFPKDLEKFKLIVHCGGCMLRKREMQSRMETANKADVPMVNYGVVFAFTGGILKRATDLT